ncbi:MAG: hypothetical protein RO469_14955 [Thermincola sp.]|jgi:hypothetical protein|nr:hypothetical protein [Thermincola sp.]MDT3702079.1 hypothetical protein [Thermincola sp.]
MKLKKKILIFILIASFSIIPTAAYASVFYDLFGCYHPSKLAVTD